MTLLLGRYARYRGQAWIGILFLGVGALLLGGSIQHQTMAQALPEPPREFRGVWVATVDNIDWPSEPGLSTEAQQAELINILDQAAALNLNAMIFQVRPAADALYDSELEPWSEYLTGKMGVAPEPYYDPLAFAIEEAHRRGLELHAWFNPYRALHPSAEGPVDANHVNRSHPEWVRTYGRYSWMDPGEPEAVDHSLRVILDVVRRYDIDAVHLDDYFYPYPVKDGQGKDQPFPDEPSWQRARAAGETLSRNDWRRQNVDQFVKTLSEKIKEEKSWVRFGISPFGIWRPGYPEEIVGFDAYDKLYADARKWQREGWIDYFSPQLYWPIDSEGQSYPVLLRWWEEQNLAGRHLWPGNYTSRVDDGTNRSWVVEEVLDQIRVTRAHEGAGGNVHFSMRALMENRMGIVEKLQADLYSQPALIPATPWLNMEAPGAPEVGFKGEDIVELKPAGGINPWLWIVWVQRSDQWTYDVVPGHLRQYALRGSSKPINDVAVAAVNRIGVQGPVSGIEKKTQRSERKRW